MPASKAQQRAVTKYVKNRYDRFGLTMPKGRLDEIKAAAAARGESVNGFINGQLIAKWAVIPPAAPQRPLQRFRGRCPCPPDTLKAAREAAEASGEALPVFVGRAVETQAQRDKLSRMMKGGKTQ